MSHAELAHQKQTTVSGNHTNYYLVILSNGVVTEIEDIIEVLGMSFALGTAFKSLVRLCKLRHDLGKPGSTSTYESQKVQYYVERLFVITRKRQKLSRWNRLIYSGRDIIRGYHLGDIEHGYITIHEPKRLDPYSFLVQDFITALEPIPEERALLEAIFSLAMLQKTAKPSMETLGREGDIVQQAVTISKCLPTT